MNTWKITTFGLLIILSGTFVSADIDMQEANVIDVQWDQIDLSNWEFSVTLIHDDDGEDGYANYWVVETLNRTELGKRILTHAHGNIEFTRSGMITIPATILKVIVRGHDQTHGLGGQVAIVDLELNTMELVDQGPDLIIFDGNSTFNGATSLHSSAIISTTQTTPLQLSNFFLSLMVIGLLLKNKRKN